MTTPIVLKIGGNDLDNPQFIDALANTVKNSPVPVVIVHGGGKEISQMQQHLGLEPRYVDGLRVTDDVALYVAQMVLCGIVNKRIVQALQRVGVEAQGISGMDRGLIQAQKMHHPAGDLGRVGEITHVRHELLTELLNDGVTPVIAPISLGDDGAYNVNADHAAGAVARALGASKVVFVTNVPGVLHNDALVSQLTPDCAHTLINDGIIHGGMLPKVSTALKLLSNDVPEVMITNLDGVLSGMGTAIAYGA
jgi:acetylglutamate kinase